MDSKKIPVDEILNHVYDEVVTLEDWINIVSSNIILPQLIQPQDSKSYIRLLKTTKVCMKKSDHIKQFPNRFSPTQNFHQEEIVLRVIERILKRDPNSKNLIVLGFSLKSTNPNTRMSLICNLEHRYPNSDVNRLQYSSWSVLLSRIGDNMMSYLLENTSIFLQIIDTTCYIQVTGDGIQDLIAKMKDKRLPRPKSKSLLRNKSSIHRRHNQKNLERHKAKKKAKYTKIKPAAENKGESCVVMECSSASSSSQFYQNTSSIESKSNSFENFTNLKTQNVFISETRPKHLNPAETFTNLSDSQAAFLEVSNSTKSTTNQIVSAASSHSKLGSSGSCQKLSLSPEKQHEMSLSQQPIDMPKTCVTKESSGSGSLCESSDSVDLKNAKDLVSLKLKNENDSPVAKQLKFTEMVPTKIRSLDFDSYVEVSSWPTFKIKSENPEQSSCSQVSYSEHTKTLKRKRSLSLSDLESVKSPRLESKLTQTVEAIESLDTPTTFSSQASVHVDKVQTDFKPFDFHKTVRRNDILCGKGLREKIPKLGNVEEIYKKITNKDIGCKIRVNDHTPPTSLQSLISDLLISYQKYPWFPILNHHCPSKDTKGFKKKKIYRNTANLLESFTPHEQVFLFLKNVIKKIIPIEMIGCQGNRNKLLKNVTKYIELGRFEKLCIGEIMTGMKIKSCTWLKAIKCPTLRSHILAKLLLWLFDDFIAVILKSFFYITNSSNYRNKIFYYRKSVWQQLYYRSIQAFKNKCNLKLISMSEVEKLLKCGKTLGVGHLKFLPKSKSCRPIINMGKDLNFPGISKTIPVNKQLLNLLQVLTSYKVKHPEVLGSSVFGADNVYNKLKQFILFRRQQSDTRQLYFVKTDITNCFDTIKPDKIFSIINHLLLKIKEDYVTQKYFCILKYGGKIRKTFYRESQCLSDCNPDFFSFIRDKIRSKNLRNLIFVDMVVNEHESTQSLVKLLHSLLFYNIIKIGRLYYKQEVGISQGSVLSTLLSNYYYGDMEAQMMSVLQDELLMRMVDDFLYITPYKHRAVEFLTTMWKGIEEYNCYVNADKIETNFTCTVDDYNIIPITNLEFSWCGFLFNTENLNVSVDYNRHQNLKVRDMLTLETGQKPGVTMQDKLMHSIGIKCHSLFFDPQINNEETIIRNISHLFQLTAIKYYCHHKHLPHKQRSNNNTLFFFDLIQSLCSYFYYHAKLNLCKLSSSELSLSLPEITWLGIDSFIKQLSLHHAEFHLLLKTLTDKFKSLSKTLGKKRIEELNYSINKYTFIPPLINI